MHVARGAHALLPRLGGGVQLGARVGRAQRGLHSLRHHSTGLYTTEITCKAVLRSLHDLVAPLEQYVTTNGKLSAPPTTPFPANGLKLLLRPPAGQGTLQPSFVPAAQKLAGTIGFIQHRAS